MPAVTYASPRTQKHREWDIGPSLVFSDSSKSWTAAHQDYESGTSDTRCFEGPSIQELVFRIDAWYKTQQVVNKYSL